MTLRIRQAECALNDRRLDEAFDLVGLEQVRRHRRGQKLIGRLTRALVERGRGHLEAHRLSQALADCDKAARLSGNDSEVACLRSEIARTMVDRQQRGREHADLSAAVRDHLRNGRLTLGERLLNNAEVRGSGAERLQQQVARQREAAGLAARKVRSALDRDDWPGAVEKLLEARQMGLSDSTLTDLAALTAGLMADRVREMIAQGRLDSAETILSRLSALGSNHPQAEEAARLLEQCRQGRRWIQNGQPRRAAAILRRLWKILPKAAWAQEAIEACEAAAMSSEALQAGPLGLLSLGESPQTAGAGWEPQSQTPASQRPSPPDEPERGAAVLPERFLIQADGVGSFLVLRGATVTIGPISSSQRPQVGLLADPALPTVTIEREEDDYFLRCGSPVQVNGRPTTERLLADGDRIALSARCRWRFVRPNAASTSVLLAMSGAALPQADTRTVILMDQEIVVGPGRIAHIRADGSDETAVLHVRGERLLCRSTAPVTADGRPIPGGAALPLDVPLRIGSLSLVITPA